MNADPALRASSLLREGAHALAGIEGSNPMQDARELLEWAAGADSLWEIRDPLEPGVVTRFREALARRRGRVPLQWITGRMHFRGLVLGARQGVFIVRPETEVVAGAAIDAARAAVDRRGRALVVDLCAGSGAIGIAVASEVPGARVAAVEFDPAAAALAEENIAALVPGRVRLELGDATSPALLAELDGSVDVVVSNPPYVPLAEAPTQIEAQGDPEAALYGGGEDGMVIPRGIIERAAALLAPGGALVLEHSPSQSELLRAAAADAGFVGAETLPDLCGRERYLLARRATMAR